MRAICHVFEWFWLYFPFTSNIHTLTFTTTDRHIFFHFAQHSNARSWYVGVISTYHRRTIHAPRKKRWFQVLFLCERVCVWFGRFIFVFLLVRFFGKRGNQIDGLSQFPARHWKVKVYILRTCFTLDYYFVVINVLGHNINDLE